MNDIANIDFRLGSKDPQEGQNTVTNNFLKVVNKHAPLKKKTVRGNDAPFMNKEFRKAIYTRTRLKDEFLKNLSEHDKLSFNIYISKICDPVTKKNSEIFT